jgi:hypothetical protein
MDQEAKIKFLQQTCEGIASKYAQDFIKIQDRHGGEFVGLVMANLGLNFLVGVLTSIKEEQRFEMMLGFFHGLCLGVDNELAVQEVEALMERIKKGPKC